MTSYDRSTLRAITKQVEAMPKSLPIDPRANEFRELVNPIHRAKAIHAAVNRMGYFGYMNRFGRRAFIYKLVIGPQTFTGTLEQIINQAASLFFPYLDSNDYSF